MTGLRFALLARTSTEDLQSPADSLAWQRARAEQITRGHGDIVAVFHDVGVSRSPWRRREQAAALIAEVRGGARRFDAVVVGELARAFGSSDQAGPVLPVLTHFGVQFWSPEFGGAYDPVSETHEILLGAFTGMSKGERTRIKIRVAAAMTEQARSGRYLGGRPPYGYTLADAGAHPNPGKNANGQRLHRLVPDPAAAPVVRRLFAMYVDDRLGARAIAQRLTDEGIPCPSAHDFARNRHRAGNGGAWSRSAVATILRNPRYTGREVWGKVKGHERLIDIDDVGLGMESRSRPQDPSEWVYAAEDTHDAVVDADVFAAAQEQIGQGRSRTTDRRQPTKRAYVLRGRIWCSVCGRRMEGDTSGGRARYRCRLSGPDYARNEALDRTHPRSTAVSERRVAETIDGWLSGLFDPATADHTVRALTDAAVEVDPALTARAAAAHARVEDCDKRLGRYRFALDSGADPAVIGQWIAEVRTERERAARDLADAFPAPAMADDEIAAMVAWFGQAADRFGRAMEAASPEARQKLYDSLGIRAYYTPGSDDLELSLSPSGGKGRVGGGT